MFYNFYYLHHNSRNILLRLQEEYHEMAARQGSVCPNWRPRSKLSSELKVHVCGTLFTVDKELLANKSEKLANLLQKNPQEEDLSLLLDDIPADQESLELVARFCHGFEINLSTNNIIRVICVSDYLGMTENQCPNNLLPKATLFFEEQIIPSWNNSIKALKSAENILQQAIQLGIIDHCAESVILKVFENPRLLGEPIKNSTSNDESDENRDAYRPNARRKLFDVNWKSEDLTTLPLRIYAPIIHAMIQRQVPKEYIAANLCQYAEKWVFSGENIEETTTTYTRNYQRETLEAIEQLLPHQKGILPITFLFEMLRFSVFLEAKTECKNGLELRIGKQLDQASVTDLLIPSQEYTNDEQYDTECVRRILKIFYSNYTEPDESSLIAISELMDDFLVEISSHLDINTNTFTAFADISVAASVGTQRTHDRIYRAIDIYLDKHRYLTESEKEELCNILDCNKLSAEACEHAAQNRKLPLRIVVQVMFVGQLKLRNAIVKEMQGSELGSEVNGPGTGGEEEVRAEMEKMGSKVLELERECSVMRREISVKKKEKVSLWREMKRKLGCGTSSVHERDCHVKKKKKKVHP